MCELGIAADPGEVRSSAHFSDGVIGRRTPSAVAGVGGRDRWHGTAGRRPDPHDAAPPAPGAGVARILPGLGIFVVFAALFTPSGSQLLLGGGGFAVAALPLLWMGKLPADLPHFNDPNIYRHRDYDRIYRRGLIAGFGLVALEIAWIVCFAIFAG
jgi:hypothetical protein